MLDEIQKRLDKLEESAPIVPEQIFLLVDEDWNSHGIKKITKADDFYSSNNQPLKREYGEQMPTLPSVELA